jgi:hypothetical protein
MNKKPGLFFHPLALFDTIIGLTEIPHIVEG